MTVCHQLQKSVGSWEKGVGSHREIEARVAHTAATITETFDGIEVAIDGVVCTMTGMLPMTKGIVRRSIRDIIVPIGSETGGAERFTAKLGRISERVIKMVLVHNQAEAKQLMTVTGHERMLGVHKARIAMATVSIGVEIDLARRMTRASNINAPNLMEMMTIKEKKVTENPFATIVDAVTIQTTSQIV